MRRLNWSQTDAALEWVMPYLDDPGDRSSVSLVCKKWHQIDALTRKHVTVAMCYSTSPARLRNRFPNLESLKIKGKPRAAMFDLVPEDWGGHAEPWIREISESFHCLKFLRLRRMIVTDDDLGLLARGRGHMLQVLKLDKCSGFSTDGLLEVARSCRYLRILFLEESKVSDTQNGWIRELALNNSVLEVLNFYMTDLTVSIGDLELLARNCRILVSLKVSECEILGLDNFFQAAEMIKEFGGGSFNQAGEGNIYENVHFPPSLSALGLIFLSRHNMSAIFPCASSLKQLDLQYTCLDMDDHCQLIQRFPSLEVLEFTSYNSVPSLNTYLFTAFYRLQLSVSALACKEHREASYWLLGGVILDSMAWLHLAMKRRLQAIRHYFKVARRSEDLRSTCDMGV